jgi:hypothetical protein
VANLLLTIVDNGKPSLSWSSGEANLQGFYIYRNGARINQTPTSSTTYSDGYYSSGNATYGVSAVDSNGTESPVKNVTLPALTIGLKDGTAMHRGVLETVVLMASIPTDATASLTIDAVSVQIGTLPSSTENGPLIVAPGTPLEIDKVAATEATAPSQEAVVVTAIMNPVPGTTVKISRSSLASVLSSGTALEIYNDPLVGGGQASVRIKVNNLGSARMEFLTSENGGPTPHVTVTLTDQDGNLLAQGNLNQQTGSVVNTGSYATARLEPGESFLSDPITFAIPSSAPVSVSLSAAIGTTWYHYGQDDQVTAPGLQQSLATSIANVSYLANAKTDKTFYRLGEPVVITGSAISTATSQPMPIVPVKIGVSVNGFDRFYTVTTDATGLFSYTFTPAVNEAGSYSVWAINPDLSDRSAQARFSIIGLTVSPALANVSVLKGGYVDLPVTISNPGGSPLTGVTLTPSGSTGITATVLNAGTDTLAAGETRPFTLRIAAGAASPDTGAASLAVATAEGPAGEVNALVTTVNGIPVIATAPSYIDTGIVSATQQVASFTITNTGMDTLKNARIDGPSTAWLSLTSNKNIGDIPVNQSKSVGIFINPNQNVPQGVYNDRLVIYSDNHIPYNYNIQVTVTNSAVGSVQFSLLDELMKQVVGANITIQNQSVTALIYNLTTAADGTASLTDIPAGRYSYNITAAGHTSYGGSFVITPGLWTTVPVALEVTLVTVEWSVTPTTIQDQYQITINQTYETNVPAPVLITEPPSITLPDMQPGQVFNGEFTVTNYGLIAVDNPQISYPTSFADYDVEILSFVMPTRIDAMQKITIPYRITKRQAVAASGALTNTDVSVANLSSEVGGYGGGSCISSVTISYITGTTVICPNTPQESIEFITSSFTFAFPVPCASSSPGTYVSSGSASWDCPNCGGGIPGGTPTPIITANPCDCKQDGTSFAACTECRGGVVANKADGTPCGGNSTCNAGNCAVCAVPTKFTQTLVNPNFPGGILYFGYTWESSTNKMSDLSNCIVEENVQYYPISTPFYYWPDPPWVNYNDNPYIASVPAYQPNPDPHGLMFDKQWPGTFATNLFGQHTYVVKDFVAIQYYQYICPCANGGKPVFLSGPYEIHRSVTQNQDGSYKYTITKSGASTTIDPLPP